MARRAQLGAARTRAKNEIHAILIRRLTGRPPVSDLFGKKGRAWLAELELPIEERETLDSGLRQIDFLDAEIAVVDRVIAHEALNWPEVLRLMTVPGVNVIAASTFLAAVGDIRRFPHRRKLVGYLGLDPRVRQSGTRPPPRPHLQAGRRLGAGRARRGQLERGPRPRPAARVLHASAPAAATRSRSRRPRASSRACSGVCSGANRTTPSASPR